MNEIDNGNEIETLKEELKQTQLAYQMAAQMSQFKAGFLARTSHELRSPLSSLIGLHQLILADLCESPEEQKEFITQAYNSAMKLMGLIDEIVSVSKTEYGTNQLKMESLHLAEVFSAIYDLTHLQAANRNLRLEITPPDYALYIIADRPRLIQSLTNLIDCGIAIMKEGKVQLKATPEQDLTKVKIEINFDCPLELWQQEVEDNQPIISHDLAAIRDLVQQINLSPQMRLLLSKTLLETMQGDLMLVDSSSAEKSSKTTQIMIHCKIFQQNQAKK